MAKGKNKSRTAAANAARRKQGPTKQTDYKNGRPVTAAAKKKSGGKRQRTNPGGSGGGSTGGKTVSFAGGKSKGEVFHSKTLGKHVTVPGASNVRSSKGHTVTKKLSEKQVMKIADKAMARNASGNVGAAKKKAGEAFKKEYKSIEKEYKDLGMKPEKQWLRSKAHTAAIKASPRAGKAMATTYAKGVARKIGIKSKAGQGQFAKGYVNAAK